MTLKDILKIERDYIKEFSTEEDFNDFAIYTDEYLKDKYFHNYYLIKKYNASLISELAKREDRLPIFRIEGDIIPSHFDFLDNIDVSHLCYYAASIDSVNVSKKNYCKVVKYSKEYAKKLQEFIYQDDLIFGESYSRRNAMRTLNVLNSSDSYTYYMILEDNEIIGILEVFIDCNFAKLDDFCIRDDMQKKGYGSTLLFNVLNDLKQKGIDEVYLVADYNDSPKDMYEKMNFTKKGEWYLIRKIN